MSQPMIAIRFRRVSDFHLSTLFKPCFGSYLKPAGKISTLLIEIFLPINEKRITPYGIEFVYLVSGSPLGDSFYFRSVYLNAVALKPAGYWVSCHTIQKGQTHTPKPFLSVSFQGNFYTRGLRFGRSSGGLSLYRLGASVQWQYELFKTHRRKDLQSGFGIF